MRQELLREYEKQARGDLQRCFIVCPGSLAEQWQDELGRRFHLSFEILTKDKLEAARTPHFDGPAAADPNPSHTAAELPGPRLKCLSLERRLLGLGLPRSAGPQRRPGAGPPGPPSIR